MASLMNLRFLDWKGDVLKKKTHGGSRAAMFIYVMVAMTSMAYVPNVFNIVTYLRKNMNTNVADSSTIITNFIGATSASSLLGGFLSDSYVDRFKTIIIFTPFQLFGFFLLALQAHIPSLQPQQCYVLGQQLNCKEVEGSNAVILYIGLYTIALGEGCMRAAIASFGGDQFNDDDPIEKEQKSSFFNWYTFGISLGVFSGLILVVWVENNKGWDFGFGLCALIILVGLLTFASGFSFYRILKPTGSPLTRMLQVFVVAFKKRKLYLFENTDARSKERIEEDANVIEILPHTNDFKFLDKATIFDGRTDDWSLCNITKVEETKIILRMIPIFLCVVVGYIPIPLLTSFTIQQGITMDTRIGMFNISPATLFIIPVIFQMFILVVYDCLFMPFARKITGHVGGITYLQRVGVGFLSIILATLVAAEVEGKRRKIAKENGLLNSKEMVPMSLFWLGMQFFILGITDVTCFVGLLEFFTREVSSGMKSIGTAIFWCAIGIASLLGTIIVRVLNKVTRHGEKGMGWLDGGNLNQSRLDLFYWFLCVLGTIGFFNYLYWARRYVYRQNSHVCVSS